MLGVLNDAGAMADLICARVSPEVKPLKNALAEA